MEEFYKECKKEKIQIDHPAFWPVFLGAQTVNDSTAKELGGSPEFWQASQQTKITTNQIRDPEACANMCMQHLTTTEAEKNKLIAKQEQARIQQTTQENLDALRDDTSATATPPEVSTTET